MFDVPTWFLMCLVVVECIHYAMFRFLRGSYDNTAADDPFWGLTIGDPGKDRIFDDAVYQRGAMVVGTTSRMRPCS